jgi:hypothetical protein
MSFKAKLRIREGPGPVSDLKSTGRHHDVGMCEMRTETFAYRLMVHNLAIRNGLHWY